MPDILAHYCLGNRVLHALTPQRRESIHRGLFDLATLGPDPWFSYRFYLPSRQEGKPAHGGEMHNKKTGAFLTALCREAQQSTERDLLFSYLAGFLCHYALDSAAHPYIIYRTGHYDGTEATRMYRGNHTYLERALDLMVKKREKLPGRPILKKVLYMRRLPKGVRPGLDRVFKTVYGWENASADMDRCIFSQRLFYLLMQDRTGLLDRLLRRVDNGKSKNDLTSLCYYGKERPQIDVANEAHHEWMHPCDKGEVSRDSFFDRMDQAATRAEKWIAAAARCIYDGEEIAENMFENRSYKTGFDCEDNRHTRALCCEPFNIKEN